MADPPRIPFSNIRTGPSGGSLFPEVPKIPFSNINSGGLGSKSVRELAQVLSSEKEKGTKNTGLSPPASRPGIGVTNSSAKEAVDKRLSGGISSPLTEGTSATPATLQRVYYAAQLITSTDGLIIFQVEQLQDITFVDGLGSEISLQFQQEV